MPDHESTGSRIFERLILIILLFAALLFTVRLVNQRSSFFHGDPRIERAAAVTGLVRTALLVSPVLFFEAFRAAIHDARDEGHDRRVEKLKRARKYTKRHLQ